MCNLNLLSKKYKKQINFNHFNSKENEMWIEVFFFIFHNMSENCQVSFHRFLLLYFSRTNFEKNIQCETNNFNDVQFHFLEHRIVHSHVVRRFHFTSSFNFNILNHTIYSQCNTDNNNSKWNWIIMREKERSIHCIVLVYTM